MDPVGDHALCCAKLGLCARHDDDLRDEFAALCVEVGLVVNVEKGRDNLRPVDVLVHGIENSPLAVDFSVVSFATLCRSGGGAPWKVGSPGQESKSSPYIVVWDGLSALSSSKPWVAGAAKTSSQLSQTKLPLPLEEWGNPLLKNMPGRSTTIERVDRMENGAEEYIMNKGVSIGAKKNLGFRAESCFFCS